MVRPYEFRAAKLQAGGDGIGSSGQVQNPSNDTISVLLSPSARWFNSPSFARSEAYEEQREYLREPEYAEHTLKQR